MIVCLIFQYFLNDSKSSYTFSWNIVSFKKHILLTIINNGQNSVQGQGTKHGAETYLLSLKSKHVDVRISRLLATPAAGSCQDGSADGCQCVYLLSNLKNAQRPKIRVPGAPAKVHCKSRSSVLIGAANSSRIHY